LALERLMLLDAVLTTPDVHWLTTASEKGTYLANLMASAAAEIAPEMPAAAAPRPLHQLSATFPISLDSDGRPVLLYLATEPWTDGFRSFLQEHAALLRVAPTWTLRLVFPRPLDRVYDAYQTVIREELESPLHAATIHELQWYFEHRRQAAEGPVHPLTRGLLEKGSQLFGTPRFTQMYRRWLKQGDAVFEGPSSPAIAEALNAGSGTVESVVLRHVYRHLSPLVARDHEAPVRVEKGGQKGGHCVRTPSTPSLNPLLDERHVGPPVISR
jgi:hypothetical protein